MRKIQNFSKEKMLGAQGCGDRAQSCNLVTMVQIPVLELCHNRDSLLLVGLLVKTPWKKLSRH